MTWQSDSQIEWTVSEGLTDYASALSHMEARAAAIAQGVSAEQIWLLEHPPLYTAGTSADPAEMLDPRFPVFTAGRGGRYTYHGPGQRVGYVMLDLKKRGPDVRCFVHALEGWVICGTGGIWRRGQACRGAGWHLDRWSGWQRGQNWRNWGACSPLGDVSRLCDQCSARPFPFFGNRALRLARFFGDEPVFFGR